MIYHLIIGFFCVIGFGRLLILFKRFGKKEYNNEKTINEFILIFVLLFISPFIVSLFVSE
jgi:Na+-driven multidrug efflux pump